MSDLQSKIKALLSLELSQALTAQCLLEIAGTATKAPKVPIGAPATPKAASTAAPKAAGKASKRLARRTVEQIQEELAIVVAHLKKHPKGLHSEEIREALQLDRRAVPRTLAEGLLTKALKKKGTRRATVYFAA